MSVTTTADEHLEMAKQDVQRAITHLSQIVVDECWGADNFSEDAKAKFTAALIILMNVRKQLA